MFIIRLIIRFAINRPISTVMFFLAVSMLGVISWRNLSVQLIPNITLPQLYIQGSMPGASPDQVEKELIIPIEGEVGKLDDVERVTSLVRTGGGSVVVEFKLRVNMKFAAMKLEQRINALNARLPQGARAYGGRNIDTELFSNSLMNLSVRGGGDVDRLRKIAEERIKPELEKIDGIASVTIAGGRVREVQIDVDEYRARQFGLTLPAIMNKINAYNRQKEFLGTVVANNTYSFVTISGQITRLEELENVVINPNIPLKLEDVAAVNFGGQTEQRIFRINSKSSVGIFLTKDPDSNLLRLADKVENEIAELNNKLKADGVEIVIDNNAADTINKSIYEVEKLAIIGALLALLVLLFFVRNIKTVSAIVISIPLSLLITFNLMYYFELSVNLISLIGLSIAVGMLLDNSIVVMENIFRHYENGKSPQEASYIGCTEVSKAIISSTITTIIIFIPLLLIEEETIGVFRVVVKEIFLAISLPLCASLLVAYTVIPLYTSRVLASRKTGTMSTGFHIGIIQKWQKTRIMEIFAVLFKSRLRNPGKTIIVMLFLFIVTPVITLPLMRSFFGVREETSLPISIETPRGTNLSATDMVAQEVEHLADSLKYLKQMTTNVSPERGQINLEFFNQEERKKEALDLDKVRDELDKQIQEKRLNKIADATIRIERLGGGGGSVSFNIGASSGGGGISAGGSFGGEVGMGLSALLGSGEEIIHIKGFDQTNMRYVAEDIIERLTLIPEVRKTPRSNLRGGDLELQIWGDQTELALNNMTIQTVMDAVGSLRRQGQEMTTRLKDEEGEYIIRLRLKEEKQREINDIRTMNVTLSSGEEIPIQNVSRILVDRGPNNINRVGQERQVEIRYSFRDEYVPNEQATKQVREKVDAAVRSIVLPPGFTLEIEHPENPFYKVAGRIFLIGFFFMYCILAISFESFILPLLIFFTAPLAIMGSLWFMLVTGTPIQPVSFMAIFILLGIAVNNGIILIDYAQILHKEHLFSRNRAIMNASRARVRPILMTSVTTILGVLPLAIWPGTADDIWKPFAVSIIGGLGFATLLTLIFIPMLYMSFTEFFNGFKKGGTVGIITAVVLNVGSVLFIWFIWLDSTIYKIVFTIFFLTVINYVLWNGYRYLDKRKRRIEFGNNLQIDIRNLTKIYNEPNKFIKDFNKRARRIKYQKEKGLWKVDRRDILEGLIWKVPIFIFFLFMHYSYIQNYFSNRLWLFVLTACTYFIGKNILSSLWLLIKKESFKNTALPIIRRLVRAADIGAVLCMFAYLHLLWETHYGWTITWCSLWLFLWYAKTVTQKIYTRQLVVDKIRGPFKKLRRLFYQLLLKIPIIGRKRFEVRALHNVNLTITNGMFGLLGPNGAGKTTLMRLVANLFYQSRGMVYINGYTLSENRDFIQKYIGYLPQKFGLYGNFTAWNYLNFIAILNRWGAKEERHHLVESVLHNINLWDRRNDKIKTYSGGMKQRVGVAQALLNLPRIIIVDEPTAGLDPRERIRFRNMLAEMSQNRIVIFSTHIVEDISTSCRELAVLNKGKVLFNGTPENMRQMASGKVWESVINEDSFKEVNSKLQIVSHIRDDGKIRIRFISASPPLDIEPKPIEPTLEDAYLVMLNAV